MTAPALPDPWDALDALADQAEASAERHHEWTDVMEAQLLRRQAQASVLAEVLGEEL